MVRLLYNLCSNDKNVIYFIKDFSFATARHPRIFNGKNAQIEQYPYHVSLEFNGKYFCGGSIIAENYVLTAAHCSNSVPDILNITIRAGTSFRGKSGSLHQTLEFIVPPRYDSKSLSIPYGDIAIIRVDQPFDYDETRQPIELFNTDEDAIPGSKAIVTGFGLVNLIDYANKLQMVVLDMVSRQNCESTNKFLLDGQICAHGDNGKDICNGDSGGPLVIDGRQAGIVSWSATKCGDSNFYSVYTELASYRDWINKHVRFYPKCVFLNFLKCIYI